MKYNILAAALIIFCLSCSDDEASLMTPHNYVPMAIGNYWIYQTHIIKLVGTETLHPKMDSVVITGDSIINGMNYYVYEGTDFISKEWRILALRRADGDDIIDPEGLTHFSSTNFSDTLYRYTIEPRTGEWICIDYRMHDSPEQIEVPAGEFDVLDYRGSFQTNIPTPYPLPRFIHNYYSSDVGLVLRNTFLFSSGTTIEERLVRYSVQN